VRLALPPPDLTPDADPNGEERSMSEEPPKAPEAPPPGETEEESSGSADNPAGPAEDDPTPLGDTDQHSDAQDA